MLEYSIMLFVYSVTLRIPTQPLSLLAAPKVLMHYALVCWPYLTEKPLEESAGFRIIACKQVLHSFYTNKKL